MGVSAIKYNRGHVRDDGMIFWAYDSGKDKKARWVNKSMFNDLKSKSILAAKKWNRANPEKARCAVAKYDIKNREKRKQYTKDNRERSSKRAFEWKKNNKQRNDLNVKNWKKENKALISAQKARRRAIEKNGISEGHCQQIENILHETRIRLNKCTGVEWNVDHIIPLAIGGKHHHTNLQLLPKYWNLKKNMNQNYQLPSCYTVCANHS